MFYMFSVAALVNCGCSVLLEPFINLKSVMPYEEIGNDEFTSLIGNEEFSSLNKYSTEEKKNGTSEQCRNADNDTEAPYEKKSLRKVNISITSP